MRSKQIQSMRLLLDRSLTQLIFMVRLTVKQLMNVPSR